MKKVSALVLCAVVCMTSIPANAFFFNGQYERTTSRGYRVGHRAATIGEIGDWLQVLIPLSGLAYSTAIGDYQGDLQWAESVGATFLTTEILKYTVQEERPSAPEGTKGHTFPSGHTSFAFAGAGYWQRRYGWYIGAPMYAAAAFVAYSRVPTKMHNWADVAFASALGIGFNYVFTTRYTGDSKVSIEPTDGGAYLNFKTRF